MASASDAIKKEIVLVESDFLSGPVKFDHIALQCFLYPVESKREEYLARVGCLWT